MEVLDKKEINDLKESLKSKGYKIYDKPDKLNIVGVRSSSTKPNSFDDRLYVFYKTSDGIWKGKKYPNTTDPGTYWLKNPMNVDGTAMLKAGQYVDAYAIGLHRGKYSALTQKGKVTVYRDYNRDDILDFNKGKEHTGLFGINIHKAGKSTENVEKYSAGCQVFKNESDFNDFMELVNKDRTANGNNFTYTLIDEREYTRKVKRIGVYILSGLLITLAGYYTYRYFTNPIKYKGLKKIKILN